MSAIPSEIRDRVITAAVELYEQAGRERFPTVDAVRRLSRADMNAVSTVMKEWRQAQTTQAAPVAVAVPEAIQQANAAAVAALWMNATELANQSLRSAQAGWEKERQELDDLRAELANSYEAQATEFETIKKWLADSEVKSAEQVQELAAVCQSEAEALHRAERAEARISEIEHRAADLRGELDRSIQEIDRQRAELATVKTQAVEHEKQAAADALRMTERLAKTEADRDQVRTELATVTAKTGVADQWHQEQRKTVAAEALRTAEQLTKAEADRDAARQQASAAREDWAKLVGKLEATEAQLVRVMAAPKTGKSSRQQSILPE